MSRLSSDIAVQPVKQFFPELFQQHPIVLLQETAEGLQVSPAQISAPAAATLRIWDSVPDALNMMTLRQILQPLAQPVLALSCQPHADLAPALELRLQTQLSAETVSQLRELAATLTLELNYLTTQPKLTTPGVLVMDMDSTAIQIECIDEIALLAGVGPQVAAVTAAAMRGELDFAQSLRQRVATLKDAPEQVLATVLEQLPLMPGLEALVATLLQHNWTVAIASGGFTYFTEALKQRLALSATFANVLEIRDGKLTGQVVGDIVDAQVKAQVVQQLAAGRDIPHGQTVAIGDGANDLPMLAVAGLGVAFHAKPLVQAKAQYAIRQGSLLQLLYLFDTSDISA
ncbi:phosphoserine phosphatase SerB [Rheinheimera sp. F8]|uniref:phosphoserine phosphatase SerB n=1 Tax=Rheinheimera sp. F8 TaxID=1763998 RepID=UPI000744CA32|nr:phosphoserine phosphatase SerB [Rheinheimera sp. F8]ALZ76215.1 HAD family hydrolase [Rheinheimera sp. F8]ALZ77604.1 HAD family hydrolase [Rheinheimera sp. F8]